MKETDLTEDLDRRGLLEDAHGPGCYALELAVPSALDAARRQWDSYHDARPPDDALERLVAAPQVAYVGASGDVYGRLCDHAGGAHRTPAVLEVFAAERVVDVWPTPNPFEREFNRAIRLVQDGWVCWVNGQVLG